MLPPHGLSSSPSFALPGRGDRIAGRYRIERKLGSGGMGVVVAALDEQTGARVAIKLLRPEGPMVPSYDLRDDSGVVERSNKHRELSTRLVREASAAARLASEHVTRVLDVGRLEHGDPYVVMELLEGHDLARYVKERGPLPIPEAVGLVLQAIEAIVEAHALGIVHRDLKPANLFLTRRPDGSPLVKVLDFGISKVLGSDDNQLTGTSDMLGSPLYMAPEQIRSARDVDARADVWSLGTILYRLLAGRAAFEAEGSAATLAAIIGDAPRPLRELRPDVPPDLEAILLRCLEKDRTRRIQSARELGIALTRFAFVQSGSFAHVTPPAPQAGLPPQVTSVPPNAVTVSGPRRRPVALFAGVAVIVFCLVTAVLVWTLPGPEGAAAGAGEARPPSTATAPQGTAAQAPSALPGTPAPGALPATGTADAPAAAPGDAPAATSASSAAGASATTTPTATAASSAAPSSTVSAKVPPRAPRPHGASSDDPLGDRL